MSETLDGQYRIEQVQILNWGGYAGLQVMCAGRSGTALLGPSGRGKSTLLDAIASVIMPNPQEFNQAARDDKRSERQRTVYSYARGLTENTKDENRRSSTPSYLRPPGADGFVSGAAVTWSTEVGRQVTAFRLAWVGPDTVDNDGMGTTTVYGFVHDAFDLTRLHGLTPARAGGAPLSPASLERLLDLSRGDVVDRRQSTVHARMRRVMSMGATEESQRLAIQLLRRAQASKGIFSINDLFKDFVLTEPEALARWDVTLEHFTQATVLFDEFELARKKTETLKDLPTTAEQYRTAGKDATVKREMLHEPDGPGVGRLQVWHAGKTLDWATGYEEDVRLEMAQVDDDLATAKGRVREAEAAYDTALEAYTAAGGDTSVAARERLAGAERELTALDSHRATVAGQLAAFGYTMPESSGDLTLTKSLMDRQIQAEREKAKGLSKTYEDLVGQRRDVVSALNDLKVAADVAAAEPDNLPPEAKRRRTRIAAGTSVPENQLPYVGELIEIAPQYRGWEKAILAIIGSFAADLVASERDHATVRAWVNQNDVGGRVSLAKAESGRPGRTPVPGTVPAMLEVTSGPFHEWVTRELERFSVLCVERDTDLDGTLPPGVVGRVTRAGMRTTSNGRVIKDDTPSRYRWIGRDNQALRARLDEELDAYRVRYDAVQGQVDQARTAVTQHEASIGALERLKEGLAWSDIDQAPLAAVIRTLGEELDRTDTPEGRQRRANLQDAQKRQGRAEHEQTTQEQRLELLNGRWGAVCSIQDACRDTLTLEPLTAEEHEATATVPYLPPHLDGAEFSGREADTKAQGLVEASYRDAARILREQVEAADLQRASHERTLLNIVRAYRNIDDRAAREVDEHIASVPALEAIREQLVTDDLNRARDRWLAKVDRELNHGLRTLLSQIRTDAHDIARGLDPVNRVLTHVEFRDASSLAIETIDARNSDLHQFEKVVLEYTRENPLGEDLLTDEAKIEKSFARLRRQLAPLTEKSRAGDAWRKRVFDAREHVDFRAIETRADGTQVVHDGVAGMSGGEGQELIAFILGAALRYRLGEGGERVPTYGSVVLDEGFVKADSDYTGRSLAALQALGFQLIVGAPREKASAFEDYVDLVAYINTDPANPGGVRIYPMTIQEALEIDDEGAA